MNEICSMLDKGPFHRSKVDGQFLAFVLQPVDRLYFLHHLTRRKEFLDSENDERHPLRL